MTIKAKKSKINLREKLAELLNFRQIRDRLDGLGLYIGKDRTGTAENVAVRGGANIDDLQLAEISAALGDTAVDVFVYDTRNDSDGGKWRERTQHTSWYNEELNTATRGGRREFPAVAVIVAESDKVTIYDGDDPDMSMWMVFEDVNSGSGLIPSESAKPQSIAALNGIIVFGNAAGVTNSGQAGVLKLNFIADVAYRYMQSSSSSYSGKWVGGGLENRNAKTPTVGSWDNSLNYIIDNDVNDVAMTVLPNSTIDSETGLPIPTIAVATDGGVSVIRDDGSVTNSSFSDKSRKVNFYNSYLFIVRDDANILIAQNINELRNLEAGARTFNGDYFYYRKDASQSSNFPWLLEDGGGLVRPVESANFGSYLGLTKIDSDLSSDGMGAWIASTYNTGWMPGDIKLAALSDTKNETVGVDETTELVENGGFNSDYTGWYGEDASLTNANHPDSGSNSLLVAPTASVGSAIQDLTTVSGQKYVLSADIAFGTGCTKITIADNTGGIINRDYFPADGNRTVAIDFDGNASMSNLQLVAYGGPAYFDNVSIKQTGELITNGTFDDGTAGWTAGTGATISVDSATTSLKVEQGTSDFAACSQPINTIVGKKYTISFDLLSDGNSSVSAGIYVRSSQFSGGSNIISAVSNSAFGSQSATFTAIGSVTYIEPGMTSSADNIYGLFDNISVRLAEDDRSANDNGLQIFGEIDKTPVAPGADLVAYSGFSAENYLMQPYNADLDFGTGDFCVMGWGKLSNNASGIINIMRNGDTQAKSWRFTLGDANGNVTWQRPDSSAMITFSSALISNSFSHYCIVRRSSTIYFYVNGVEVSSSSSGNSGDDYSSDNSVLKIYGSGQTSSNQHIALWRISATAPTADQIAKIYRDEKVLFTDGAQATLYGTSDAVTALAYDDKTELLHVGTASGRSDFSGLRRINNTTTAVTTSISASNNLIAEQ